MRKKIHGGAKFQFSDREAVGIYALYRSELYANRRPKTPPPKPPKISRTIVIRVFFVKNATKKLHRSAPKNSKSDDFGTLRITSTISTK